MDSIKDTRTSAVLVANVDRYGRCDYVGPNAFAEIAVGSGLGLAIARQIAESHDGRLVLADDSGLGRTFVL